VIEEIDGSDETISIKNEGSAAQDMTGWEIQSYANQNGYCEPADQWYAFPDGYILGPQASVQVNSGRDAVDDPPDELKWTGAYIWHNDGDVGVLYDSAGERIDCSAYGECICEQLAGDGLEGSGRSPARTPLVRTVLDWFIRLLP
jgi:hypothetical protein